MSRLRPDDYAPEKRVLLDMRSVRGSRSGDGGEMTAELELTEWLEQTQEHRDCLANYGRSPMTTDAGERQLDIDKAIQNSDEIGRLKADADAFLTQHTAQAWLEVCKKYEEHPAKVREILVRDRVRDLQRIVDGIEITERTIKNRIYAAMNANRSR